MAVFNNPNKPVGLSPVSSLLASVGGFNGQGNLYAIPAADTSGYWPGDLVMPGTSAGGTYGAGGDSYGTQYITKYTEGSTDPVLGVIVAIGTDPTGSQFINPNLLGGSAQSPGGTYRPAGAQSIVYYAMVLDDPNIIYEIQEGGTGTNLTGAACGLNADLAVAAPATVGVTAFSGSQLDNATTGTTTTLPLRILRLAPRPDNGFTTSPATGGGYQKWWVTLNNHFYKQLAGA